MPSSRRAPEPPVRSSGRPTRERFRDLDPYRAEREWLRYEGTGQRDLYRELRERFLRRHTVDGGWVLDLGSGPGRFLPLIGGPGSHRVALDISREMLNLLPGVWAESGMNRPRPDRVRGDALRPPLAPRRWDEVVVLGNTLGFAGSDAESLLSQATELVSPRGLLLLEIAPGPGEHSRYLARLPPSAAARLLRAPVRAVLPRVDREGFSVELPRRRNPGAFRRFSAREVTDRLARDGWEVEETIAVAPVLGPDRVRIDSVRSEPGAWIHLIDLEEQVGRRAERWEPAAAVLLAARRPSSKRMIK